MTVRRKRERLLSFGFLWLAQVECVAVGGASLMLRAEAKPVAALKAVCLEIIPASLPVASALSKPAQYQCCHTVAEAKCFSVQQLFPPAKPVRPSIRRSPVETLYIPRLDEAGNTISSQGAAKDAVIQLGITKTLNAIAPLTSSKRKLSDAGSEHRNLFQRAEKTYQQILGPKVLKSGAILTPRVEMNMNLGDVSLDSVKLGVGIRF